MKGKLLTLVLLAATIFLLSLPLTAAEKVRFGYTRPVAESYLAVFAAEEKGFWKENGLQAELATFGTTPFTMQALAARAIDIGTGSALTTIQAAAGGVPAKMVSDLNRTAFYLWVRADSPIKDLKDLKGAKIGVYRWGGPSHAYIRVVTKALGIEREVKYVASGTITQEMATLKAKITDAVPGTMQIWLKLWQEGHVWPLLNLADYLPKEFLDGVIFTSNDFLQTRREAVKGTARAMVQAVQFIQKNPDWAIAVIKRESGYDEKTARMLLDRHLIFTRDGKISSQAVQNVINFLIEYDLVAKDKMPPAEQLYIKDILG